jgi:hypothetical protein
MNKLHLIDELQLNEDAFEPGKVGVLLSSRGRGYSHAIRDIAIFNELMKVRDDLDLRFVSYGSGAQALSEHHEPLIDLDMPDDNPFWPTAGSAELFCNSAAFQNINNYICNNT